MNLIRNEVTRRASRAKKLSEIELQVNKEMQNSQNLSKLVAFNIIAYLHQIKVMKFLTEKDIFYDSEKVKYYSQIPID